MIDKCLCGKRQTMLHIVSSGPQTKLEGVSLRRLHSADDVTDQWLMHQGRNHVFKVGGPVPWSRLLYRTKYGWYTQFRALQSAAT